MTLLYFEIPGSGELPSSVLEIWKSRLADLVRSVKLNEEKSTGRAELAVWRGEPFILVGTPPALTRYLDGMDEDTAKVLADCAYFWLLTSSGDYQHRRLPTDRVVVLGWSAAEQNVIRTRLEMLGAFPRLKGLSKRMHFARQEIQRLASVATCPGYPVLILGGSGTGKEEVAHSLFENSDRSNISPEKQGGMYPVSGAWLNMEPGMALTELLGLEPGRTDIGVKYEGLVKLFSNGALFVDDFESAPRSVQEALLRVMSTPAGNPAVYRKVGGVKNEQTNVWLIFATNAKVDKLLQDDRLREDFIYRFEDRVLVLRTLKERPADFPAVARLIWARLWESSNREFVPLTSDVLRRLFARNLEWEGNVRTLRALLALVVSMKSNPVHNCDSPGALIDLVLQRGHSYREWVGIVETDFFTSGQSLEEQIREADAGHVRSFGPSHSDDPDESDLTESEREASNVLTAEGWHELRRLIGLASKTKSSRVIRVSVRLSRIVWYLAHSDCISWPVAGQLSRVGEVTAKRDLRALAAGTSPALITKATRPTHDHNKAELYEKVRRFFR
jgi:DNA-binding NtrC family response regulator